MKSQQEIVIGVYKIVNKITGKTYYGYSKDIYERFKKHKTDLKNNNHQNIILQRSYNKYSLESFEFIILHTYDNIEDAQKKELEYLENLELRPMLYNINYTNSGGDIISTHPDRDNIIQRITESVRERYSKMTSEEKKEKHGLPGKKNGMFGKTHTEEVKQKLRNRIVTEETRDKMSDFQKTRTCEKNSFYGKKVSEENKEKIRISNKVRKNNIETSKQITIDNINYKSLSEASEKIKINISTISWRVKSKKFENYKYTNEENNPNPISTKISVNNIEYNTITEASEQLNFTSSYITRRIRSNDEEDSEWIILDKPRDKRIQVGKKVIIYDVVYNTIREASEKLNILESVLIKRLNSTEPIPVTTKKKVSVDNIIYESVTEASKSLNININGLIKHLKSEKWKDRFYLPIEYIDLSKYKYI